MGRPPPPGRTVDALAYALLVAALAFGVHVLTRSAGLTVARPAAEPEVRPGGGDGVAGARHDDERGEGDDDDEDGRAVREEPAQDAGGGVHDLAVALRAHAACSSWGAAAPEPPAPPDGRRRERRTASAWAMASAPWSAPAAT